MCEVQCWAQDPTKEAAFLDMTLAVWKQIVRSAGGCFVLVRTIFKGTELNSDSSKGKKKVCGVPS